MSLTSKPKQNDTPNAPISKSNRYYANIICLVLKVSFSLGLGVLNKGYAILAKKAPCPFATQPKVVALTPLPTMLCQHLAYYIRYDRHRAWHAILRLGFTQNVIFLPWLSWPKRTRAPQPWRRRRKSSPTRAPHSPMSQGSLSTPLVLRKRPSVQSPTVLLAHDSTSHGHSGLGQSYSFLVAFVALVLTITFLAIKPRRK